MTKHISNIKIAAVQMTSTLDYEKNLDLAEELITQAANDGAKIIVLPEFFIRIGNSNDDYFKSLIEELGCGKIQERIKKIVTKNKIFLVAGTIPIKSAVANRCYNTSVVFDPQGEIISHYHKIHLFKFHDPQLRRDESSIFTNGNKVVKFNIGDFSFGLAICYDIRFPELFRKMAGVDAIIVSAAFLHHTGKVHWETLLKARAIENQCYIIAANQGGVHENGHHTFGHSMIINPWGHICKVLPTGSGFVSDIIDKNFIKNIRTQLPALEHMFI